MNEIGTWDYRSSVEKVMPMVLSWKNLTVDIVRELYRAREELGASGRSWMSLDVPDGTPKTWSGYLSEIGLAKSTVHRWLDRYIPEQDRLLSSEEHEQLQIEHRKEQQKERDRRERLVREKITTGKQPEEWDDELEKEYQKRVDDAAFEKRKEEAFRKNKERFEREKNQYRSGNLDREFDILERATKEYIKIAERHEHLNLSSYADTATQEAMFAAIERYLNTFDTNSGKLEAAHNLIKKLKMVANELQQESIS